MARLTVGTEDGVLVASGDEGGWNDRERLDDRRPECVAASPDRPDRIFVGTFESGLRRSTDGGETFERVGGDGDGQNSSGDGNGIHSDAVLSVAVSPHDPDVVWAGTEPSAVYRSSDGGDTWTRRPGLTDLPSADRWSFPPRPHTHHVRWIEPDPRDPERLYVGVEAGAFVRTLDGGATWRDHPDGARRDNHTLATHPDADGLVYAAAGDGFAVSRDYGATWSYPQDGLDHRYCWGLVTDPGDPETVLLSAAHGARSAHTADRADTAVYRRTGDGPWERVESDGLATGEGVTRTVFATTGQAGHVYAANNVGVFRSTDAGESWAPLPVSWPDRFRSGTCRGLAVTP